MPVITVAKNKKLELSKSLAPQKLIANNNLSCPKFNTIEDANTWAKENLKITTVDYSGFDIRIANVVNEQLQILARNYPEINTIKYVGTKRNNIKKYKHWHLNKIIKKYKLSYNKMQRASNIYNKPSYSSKHRINLKNAYALSVWNEYQFNGIWFNDFWVKRYNRLSKLLKIEEEKGWYVLGGNSINSLVTHEFGHHLYDFLKKNELQHSFSQIFSDLYSKYDKNFETYLTNNLSRYSSTDIFEFFAEAFTEYIHNPSPRPIAKMVGKEIEHALNHYRKNNKSKILL